MRNLTTLLFLFCLTSCATLITRKDYNIHISSDAVNAVVKVQDSTYALPARFKIKRSKEDLKIELMGDSLKRNYTVKASPNGAFLYGNLAWVYFAPAAYLVDFTNQKRFYYGRHIFLNSADTNAVLTLGVGKRYIDYWARTYPTRKGQVNLSIGLPGVNNFYMQPVQEGVKINTGFWGISAGLEYFYRNNKFLSLNASATMDYFLPLPVAVEYSGEMERMNAVTFALSDNFRFRRFTLGYGLNFSRNTWRFVYYDRFEPPAPSREPTVKSLNSVGLVFNGYHQLNRTFHIGLIYRPNFLAVYPHVDLTYEHSISLEVLWRIRTKK